MAEFKISRIRYTWKGGWTTAASYNKDDVVRYGGSTWVCIRQHSSTAFQSNQEFLANPGDTDFTPAWIKMTDGYAWVGQWNPSTLYNPGDIVLYGGTIYLVTASHTSAATFITNANKVVEYVSTTSWTQEWAPSTRYGVGDLVQYNGIVYKCIAEHTSGSTEQGLEIGNNDALEDSTGELWEIYNSGIEYVGEWSDNTRYRKNDLVKYGGSILRCVIGHQSGGNITNANFVNEFPGNKVQLEWSTLDYYAVGDVVQHGGYIYRANENNQGVNPSRSISDQPVPRTEWSLLSKAIKIRGEWSAAEDYKTGDLVRRGGYLYVALSDTAITGDGSTLDYLDESNWEIVVPGDAWKASWASGTVYSIGDVVLYFGNAYRNNTQHTASSENFPGDNGSGFFYWDLVVENAQPAGLGTPGDLLTFGLSRSEIGDGSTLGPTAVAIGADQEYLAVNADDTLHYKTFGRLTKVTYVSSDESIALDNIDDPSRGYDPEKPWRTIRFACERIHDLGDNSVLNVIRVATGFYDEVGPIVVPAGTAIEGNELRSVTVRASKPRLDLTAANDPDYQIIALDRISDIVQAIIGLNTALRTSGNTVPQVTDPANITGLENVSFVPPQFEIPEGGTGVGGPQEEIFDVPVPPALNIAERIQQLTIETAGYINFYINSTGTEPVYSGNNTAYTNPAYRNAGRILNANKAFIAKEVETFLKSEYPSYNVSSTDITKIVEMYLRAFGTDVQYSGSNYYSLEAGRWYKNLVLGSQDDDMFYLRDTTGIRNLTVKGLSGTLNPPNVYELYRRPTGGAYMSLDPGWGPADERCWITTRSPYIQNVTTFGDNCVGQKIDGSLHNGGNKSMVANDFTQVLSDGIGYWATNLGKSELVSVFTYYNHIGYLAENGGILRATNGNNSYGTFGSVAEGFDANEVPISAQVNNQSGEARIDRIMTDGNEILHYAYEHAGQDYTTVTASYTGPGTGIDARWTEFRNNAISNIRLTVPSDSSQIGGAGYKFISNYARGGTDSTLLIANAEARTSAQLTGMAVYITNGAGAGQYGYIQAYDEDTNTATIYRYSTGTAGWDQLIPGRPIQFVLDDSTFYEIEPRVTVSSPPWTQTGTVVQAGLGLSGFGAGKFYYPLSGTNDVYVTADGGDTWTTTNVSESDTWDARGKRGDLMMFAAGGSANFHYSNDGTSWDTSTLPDTLNWTGIAQGGSNDDKIMVVATGSDTAYIGTIGTGGDSTVAPTSWTALTLNASRAWTGVEFGQGIWFVFSSDGYYEYSTNDGSSWTAGTLPAPSSPEVYSDVAYGNNTWTLTMDNSDRMFYSDDAVNWQDSDIKGDSVREDWTIAYAGGVFVVASAQGTNAYSNEGKHWTVIGSPNANQTSVAGGIYLDRPTFLTKGTSATGERIQGGKTAHLRVNIANNNISEFVIMDPGSGYTTQPSVVVFDPEEYTEPTLVVNLNDKVLAQPEMYNRGSDYLTMIATLTGTGFADEYQKGNKLQIKGATKVPKAGSNINFAGQPDTLYKIVKVLSSSGTAPNFSAQLQISPILAVATSPDHEEAITFRERYSSCRLTGHDFLDIGTGNFTDTNYPTLYKFGRSAANETRQANEIVENNGGRVFYTSTDQDGNFRVGELFRVSQSTGGVTLNADFFDLGGLDELRLGGIQVGGTQATIKEFSTDNTMTANSDSVIPTQRAIKAYLENRITGGGATLFTNAITAGVVVVQGQEISTTEGIINVTNQMNLTSGSPDGDMAAHGFFIHGMDDRNEFNG